MNESELHQSRKNLVKTIFTGETPKVKPKNRCRITEAVPTTHSTNTLPLREVNSKFEEYFTGFFEGDGHLGQSHASLTQINADLLLKIQERLEGGILRPSTKEGRGHSLVFGGDQYKQVLELLSRHVVSNSKFLSRLNYELSTRSLSEITSQKPTPMWFVGFWDAEGYSTKQRYTTIGVGQKDKLTLVSIQELFNVGKIYTRKDGISTWHITSLPKYREKFDSISNLLIEKSLNEEKRLDLIYNILTGGPGTRKIQDEGV